MIGRSIGALLLSSLLGGCLGVSEARTPIIKYSSPAVVYQPEQGLTKPSADPIAEESPPQDKGVAIPTPHVGVLPLRPKTKQTSDETIEMEELRLRREDEETKRRMQICSDC